jgi:SAM-dependent MidA family methyltransferase
MTARTPLHERLLGRIANEGPLAVDVYMAACLADPEHGYYRRRMAIGRQGDFVTAPEISQVFGELLGLWSAVVWRAIGEPSPLHLVEFGPGRGTLMADVLRASRRVGGFAAALDLHLVEISPALRAVQGARLAGAGLAPTWHEAPSSVPAGPAIILANEFLDALPIRQLVHAGAWCERVVEADADGALRFAVGPPVADSGLPSPAADGDVFELRPAIGPLLDAIAARAGAAPTAALFIDYGHLDSASGDTLQAVSEHAFVSPLERPGLCDLSSHVDFAAFAAAARQRGLAVDGPLSQGEFLGRLGLVERIERLMGAAPVHAAELESGGLRLISPGGMGSRFKAIGLRGPALPRLPGF